jgi:hypothetical protein
LEVTRLRYIQMLPAILPLVIMRWLASKLMQRDTSW